jgi:hypothetical protein
MAHIHEKIDFTVAIFVVHEEKILLVHHRQLDQWPPASITTFAGVPPLNWTSCSRRCPTR